MFVFGGHDYSCKFLKQISWVLYMLPFHCITTLQGQYFCPQFADKEPEVTCVCYLLGNTPPQNLVAVNDENINFVCELAVWPGLGGDNSFYFTRCHLEQLKGWGLELSEGPLICTSGGWCHLWAEHLAGTFHKVSPCALAFLVTWALRTGVPKERGCAGNNLYHLLWPGLKKSYNLTFSCSSKQP